VGVWVGVFYECAIIALQMRQVRQKIRTEEHVLPAPTHTLTRKQAKKCMMIISYEEEHLSSGIINEI